MSDFCLSNKMPVITSFTEIHFVLAHSTRRFYPWRIGPTALAGQDIMLQACDGTKTSPHGEEPKTDKGRRQRPVWI